MQSLRVRFTVRSRVLGAGLAMLYGALFGALPAIHAAGAAELPAGPNRDLVARECQACHDLDMVIDAAGASREAWDGALDEMTRYGLSVSAEDRAKILDYLATALGPSAKASPATR